MHEQRGREGLDVGIDTRLDIPTRRTGDEAPQGNGHNGAGGKNCYIPPKNIWLMIVFYANCIKR